MQFKAPRLVLTLLADQYCENFLKFCWTFSVASTYAIDLRFVVQRRRQLGKQLQ